MIFVWLVRLWLYRKCVVIFGFICVCIMFRWLWGIMGFLMDGVGIMRFICVCGILLICIIGKFVVYLLM